MKIKKISSITLIFSILLSLSIIIGNKIVFKGVVYENNYLITNYNITDIILFFLIILFSYLSIFLLKNLSLKIYNLIFKHSSKKQFIFCMFSVILFIFVFFIYFFTFYPGGLYTDTFTSFYMISGKEPFTSHHPVLYTLSTFLILCIKPKELGVCIFALCQIIFMIFVLTYFIYWLHKKQINKYLILLITLFFALFKLYPLYSISLWKDTPFSLSLFLYTLTFIDLIIESNSKKITQNTLIKFNIFTLLVIFLRNNRYFYNTYLFFYFVYLEFKTQK